MVRIYGASDDLVEIEDSEYHENEIGCFEKNVRIWFKDGTVILVGYPKECCGIWWIQIERAGDAYKTIQYCNDEDADIYSDIFEIDSTILKVWVIRKEET